MGVRGKHRNMEASAAEPAGYIVLTIKINEEDGLYVARVVELGVSSFGETIKESLHEVMDAVIVYLNTLETEGEINRIFKERGIEVQLGSPPTHGESLKVEARPMEVVSPWAVSVPVG